MNDQPSQKRNFYSGRKWIKGDAEDRSRARKAPCNRCVPYSSRVSLLRISRRGFARPSDALFTSLRSVRCCGNGFRLHRYNIDLRAFASRRALFAKKPVRGVQFSWLRYICVRFCCGFRCQHRCKDCLCPKMANYVLREDVIPCLLTHWLRIKSPVL